MTERLDSYGLMKPANTYLCFFTHLLPIWLAAASPAMALAEGNSSQTSLVNYSDTSITLLHGTGFEIDPHLQTSVTVEHFSDLAFGDLFAFIDYYKFHGAGTDWYGEFSPRLSLGKISGTDMSFGLFHSDYLIVEDLLVAGTYERGKKPDQTEAFLLGLGFDLKFTMLELIGYEGFQYANINLYARKDPGYGFEDIQLTFAAAYPFAIGETKFLADGFIDYIAGLGPKAENLHFVPQKKLDIGNYWNRPDQTYLGFEYDYWSNKFGVADSPALDSDQHAVSAILQVHF